MRIKDVAISHDWIAIRMDDGGIINFLLHNDKFDSTLQWILEILTILTESEHILHKYNYCIREEVDLDFMERDEVLKWLVNELNKELEEIGLLSLSEE